jgi:hypothetical protein
MLNIIRFLYSLYRFHKNGNNVTDLINCTKRCGTVAIKLLQFICMRNNIKNKQLQFVFEDCDIHSLEDTKRMYFEDFGKKLSSSFMIRRDIIGSGSIGQVYRFYSLDHDKFVALKSKHPGVDKEVYNFIKTIKVICWFIYPFNMYHQVIMEYTENIKLQLDYDQEAKNTIKLKELWRNEECVIVPEVYYHSKNFICMSYHEGENFNNISEAEQLKASVYLNFIFLTGLLKHDFLHADLHTGNWKIVIKENTMKILLYDCGVMCRTGDLEKNKLIIATLLSGQFDRLVYIIGDASQKRLDDCSRFIRENLPGTAMERTQFFIEKVLKERLISNKMFIHILTALAIVGEICDKSGCIFTRYTGKEVLLYECMVYMYISILNRLQTFTSLKTFLQDWMDSDKIHKERYIDWLMDRFGHKKEYILDNIIYGKFNLK